MHDVIDYAKFFLKKEDKNIANTYDGNMKLQKLLSFADIISFAKYNKPLFDEPVLAFENGFVVESIRQRYKYDYEGLKKDSDNFNPNFSEEEYQILNATYDILGGLTPKELSCLSHSFECWSEALKKGYNGFYHDKEVSIANLSLEDDINRVLTMLDSYEKDKHSNLKKEIINGSTFILPTEPLSEELFQKIVEFSKSCPPDTYSVLIDNDELVVF